MFGAAGWGESCNFSVLSMPERGQRYKSEHEGLNIPICAYVHQSTHNDDIIISYLPSGKAFTVLFI